MASFHYLVLPMIVFVSFDLVQGRGINQTCTRNGECGSQHSVCDIYSPTCGGVCSCVPGFTYDSATGDCKRAAYLGGSCSVGRDVCVGDNMDCTGAGTCSCNFGYKQGIYGTDCVPNLMTQVAGDTCHDSAQCYYSLVCIGNKCGCYTGYKSTGRYSCSPRQVYDSCTSNDDCQMAPNTVCSNGRCDCLTGYRAIQYQINIVSKAYACVGSTVGYVGEGSTCNLDAAMGSLVYCKAPFVCSPCGEKSICIRQQPKLYSHASSLQLSILPLLLAIVAAFW